MKLAAALLSVFLVLPACSLAEPAGPVTIEVGKTFELKAGASAKTTDGALRLGFDSVTADSRCPKGEQCVWAGDATLKLWVQQGTGPRQTRELRATAGTGQALRLPGHALRLVRLAPDPVTGKSIAATDYVATFALSRDTGTDAAER